MTERICSEDGCSKPVLAKALCSTHYQRARRDPRPCPTCRSQLWGSQKYCSTACRPRCSIDACERPERKRGWCATHYHQWLRTGSILSDEIRAWNPPRPCKVCGKAPSGGYREFCSSNCMSYWQKSDGRVVNTAGCGVCGTSIDLLQGASGKRRKSTIKVCDDCKPTRRQSLWMLIPQLVERDGDECRLCESAIDLTLTHKSPGANLRASVDHIVPWSHGGSDDLSNLQLAHLRCNIQKGNRVNSGEREVSQHADDD